eukprot:CAMPEP_0172442902 /NCGR_PEP_ID=MMETSP1065-20121228/3256_1 /TAXON_ID=265537 /ORGANISM="Amphiprora paludosa, Strain CCMP125" /LENGTH=388 /DNA_ID=CAMNT_0013192947 /DNA_START=38 /DNA_END=1204 /DNA_ORIENTATION=+
MSAWISGSSESLASAAESLSAGASKAASAITSARSSSSSRSTFGIEAVALAAGISLAAGVGITYVALNFEKWTSPKKTKYEVPPEIESSPFHQHVKLAIELTLKAGENMRTYCDEKGTLSEHSHDTNVSFKGKPADFCTKIDVENEHLVMEGIREVFPSHKIIGGETTGRGEIPSLTKYPTWIVDPIDGTTNFASGLPLCCVSVGFCLDGKPLMGVVYAPMTDELYIGVVAYGAYRNGVKILPAKQDTPLKEAVVCFEFGNVRGRKEVSSMIKVVEDIMVHGCRTSRQIGSGVLDLCYVATGRLDVVYAGVTGDGWKPWDLCAGYVIAKEAGCVMESFQQFSDPGEFDLYAQNHICATNKNLLADIRTFVKEEWHELAGNSEEVSSES